jgi:hypothetical protein
MGRPGANLQLTRKSSAGLPPSPGRSLVLRQLYFLGIESPGTHLRLRRESLASFLGRRGVLQRTLEPGPSWRLYCTIRRLPFVARRWRRQATEVS